MPLLALALMLMQLPTASGEEPRGVLIERRLAEGFGVWLGDTVSAGLVGGSGETRPFVVEGIFERAADPNRISRNDYEVRFHLPDLEGLLPTGDRVDRFAVELAPGASAERAARWMEGLAYGTQAYGTAELAEETSATFAVISRFHRAIGVVTILASGIFLLCVMIIRVDERRRDVGMLRLIGVSRRTVFRTVVLEAIGIAGVGTAAGALLGAGITRLVNAHYAGVYDTTLRFALLTPEVLRLAAVLGLVLGVAAGTLAALRVVRIPPERLGQR